MKSYLRIALFVVVVALLLGTAFSSVASASGPYWNPGWGYHPTYYPGNWGGYNSHPYPYPTYWYNPYPSYCGSCYQQPYYNTYWPSYGWNYPYNAWYPNYGYGYQYPYYTNYWNNGWYGYQNPMHW
jgi:hypothetical protein